MSPNRPAESRPEPPLFVPVPVRYRRDGWTPERQLAFIAALHKTRCILEACRRVGKSPEAACKLYRRPGAEGFRAAWQAAFQGPKPPPPSTSAPPWHVSELPASSTSAPSTSAGAAPTAARARSVRHPLPPYSLEAFARAVRLRPPVRLR